MTPAPETATGRIDYVLQRYDDAIGYYWKVGARNKRAYKWSRYLSIVFGATVTLFASLMSADFVADSTDLGRFLAISTPVLSALLAVIGGFGQNFNWGAAWREMVLTAEKLEKERDRVRVSRDENDAESDLAVLNDMILAESRSFFDRILGTSKTA